MKHEKKNAAALNFSILGSSNLPETLENPYVQASWLSLGGKLSTE